MPPPRIVDIEALSQAISPENPQGCDIRLDHSANADYYRIKDARNGARAAERAQVFDDESIDTLPLWQPVLDIAPDILLNTSKDLEIVSWYIEALVRFHGFAGLREGLELCRVLIEKYWDNLYPEPDEDGLETKVAPLTGLNGDGGEGTLLAPIRNCMITTEGNNGTFTYWQYQQARDTSKIADDNERQSRFEALGFTLQNIESTIASGSADFYNTLITNLEDCSQQFQTINELLIEHCAHEAPPSTSIRELLDEVLRASRFLCKDKLEVIKQAKEKSEAEHTEQSAAQSQDKHSSETNASPSQASRHTSATGPIAGREDALHKLQDIADYFRLHEPHTPLAPAIERIVDWGRMNVAELIMELVPDDSARAILAQLTGVKLDGSDKRQYVAPPPLSSADTTAPNNPGDNNESVGDTWEDKETDDWESTESSSGGDDLSW